MPATLTRSRDKRSRHAAPPLKVSAEYSVFGQLSIQPRNAAPPGRSNAASSSSDRLEQAGDAREQPVGDHRIEALAVVVDHPPDVAHVVLPAFEHGLEDVALVELGVADQRDQPALLDVGRRQVLEPHVVLNQRAEQRDRDAEADRAGRIVEVERRLVLGARRVRLRATEHAEALQLVEILVAEQILDGVQHRAAVRLDRDPVLRPQHLHVQRRH